MKFEHLVHRPGLGSQGLSIPYPTTSAILAVLL
jgi:hypothetical protein